MDVPWPEEVTIGEVRYPPGGAFGPRVQPYAQLVFLHTGWMTVWIDGVARHAEAGTAALLLPGHTERFAFAETRETHHSWMHAAVGPLSGETHASLAALPWPIPLSQPMTELFRQAQATRASTLPTATMLLRALGAHMLWRYIGEARQLHQGGGPGEHPAIEQARQFIDMHLAEPCTLETIAHAASVSPAHLIRLFRSHLGTTPIAYMWCQRVARGVDLLQHTGLSVGEIAARCGFQTSYHFSRQIRATTGRTPSELRAGANH